MKRTADLYADFLCVMRRVTKLGLRTRKQKSEIKIAKKI